MTYKLSCIDKRYTQSLIIPRPFGVKLRLGWHGKTAASIKRYVKLEAQSSKMAAACIESRILDIIIGKDKTLVCAFEDNFKQNGVNSGLLLPAIRVNMAQI